MNEKVLLAHTRSDFSEHDSQQKNYFVVDLANVINLMKNIN